MLAELSIRNFAIIEQLTVSFNGGLTVLTGETGAGKSIIIDAVQLLAGGRASTHFIRFGAERAEIEGLFYIPPHEQLKELLRTFGIEAEDELIIRRELNRNGKTTTRINGKLVTIAILREVTSFLIDIHGQHENQELMQEKYHIVLLDQFAGESFHDALAHYSTTYERYVKLKQTIARAIEDEQLIAQHIDLYSFQLKEIDEAELQVDEDIELENEKMKLDHYNRLYERLNLAYEALNGESKGLDYVGSAMSDLEDAMSVDTELKPLCETVSSSFYSLQDAVHTLRQKIDEMEYDPARVEYVESRLALLANLKRKYGQTVEEILLYRETIEEKLNELLHRDEVALAQQEMLEQLEADLQIEAEELSFKRKKVAKKLEKAIIEQLSDLHMAKANFVVSIERKDHQTFDQYGYDDVQFLISTNVGEPLQPLIKVASGGEISRMMLALKTVFSEHRGITSIIFDEVDTGVSGRVAQSIAEKIAMIGAHSQVLCISHLPQVAAMADYHYFIAKSVSGERTTTTIAPLAEAERTEELSRMLSGAEITPLSLKAANELLQLAERRKSQIANKEGNSL